MIQAEHECQSKLDPDAIKGKGYLGAKSVTSGLIGKGEIDMADEKKDKCARATCGCPPAPGSDYCSPDCENASKVHIMEISCSCHHPQCS